MGHVVETQPNVHYLIDFEDGQGDDVDQVDRFDFSFPNIFNRPIFKDELHKLFYLTDKFSSAILKA